MRDLPHILSAFYGEPWHLRAQEWRNFDALIQRVVSGGAPMEKPTFEPVQFLPAPLAALTTPNQRPVVGPVDPGTGRPLIPQMEIVGPVAIIPVYGVLGRHLSMLALLCGGCDYAHIEAFVQMAAEDPGVSTVIFDYSSPGGQASGCAECAESIAALDKIKPTIGFIGKVGASACYWLASQNRMLLASATAIVGNVGTIMAGEDTSEQWAKEGRKLELFVSDPLKAAGWDGKPWTDQDRAYYLERCMQATARIKSGVKAGRPQIKDEAMDGRWFFAENSIELGVVDEIAKDLTAVVEALV